MATIKAPFNFVPVSDKVFFPDWADQISHDIPFEDGESGVIELTITAESPIFVRNGHTKKDGEEKNNIYKSYSKINNRYFIPATSIKGTIRNVLEIMSFGKMRVDKNAMFAQRDWGNEVIYPMKKAQSSIRCGWLTRSGNNYQILDCGKPYRIGHKLIDKRLPDTIFENMFSKRTGIDLTEEYPIGEKKFDPKTAAFKYEIIKEYDYILTEQNFEHDEDFCNEYKENRLKFSDCGTLTGKLVLTGQPDKWVWPRPKTLTRDAGKYYEFVFLKPEGKAEYISLTQEEFNHFKFIYSESPEWERAKRLLVGEGIPIFFRKTKQGTIKDLGLAFLYKLPYDRSPFDTLGKDHKDETKIDLADCIFGFINLKDKKDPQKTISLKGRVQFSPAFSENAESDKETFVFTLNSPKASYYPLYIKQEGRNNIVNNYKTYNDGIISGWKRYPVRKEIWGKKDKFDEKLDTIIHPVQKGSIFIGKVRYNNLKRIELGALLSALTFHNMSECYHQIGQGKPYGFGKVKIDIKLPDELEKQKLELMALFEYTINQQVDKWYSDTSIEQLFTMAKEEITADSLLFQYMKMDTDRANNQFLTAKENREYLELYSKLRARTTKPVSLVSQFIDKFEEEKRQQSFIEEQKRIEEEQQKQKELSQKKEEEAKLQQEILKKKIENGLVFLAEKNMRDEYKVQDFKGAKSRIEQWMKKTSLIQLPENQLDILFECISRLMQSTNKQEKKDWYNLKSPIWQSIQSYVGLEKANEWFDKLNKDI
jgi:CRISPR-associated protein (TIGR03986 family)